LPPTGRPPEAEFKPVVEAYRGAIQSLRDPIETGNPAGRRLYGLLLAPLAKLIPPGARVIVAPDGCLHGLNLETLPVAGERPHYWLEDVTIAVVPSLAMLATGAQDRRGAPDSLLLIGNPVPPGSEFPPLPDVERELEGIRQRFAHSPQLTITGAAAHPGAYREANPGQFSLIHFSAHATANRESPLDSAVILSPKDEVCKLYAREVVGIPLQARLVTISACRGAGARLYAGEGLVGFAWAFLQAGARNVVAGLWDVNDRSTAQLMVGLYARLSENSGVAEALRSAKLALLRSPGPYRKPYYWAPFQVFTRSPDF
jgi:CHAT domain-containing protein